MAVPIVEEARRFYDPGCPFGIPVPEGSLFELLDTSAGLSPGRVAIDYFGREISYWNSMTGRYGPRAPVPRRV